MPQHLEDRHLGTSGCKCAVVSLQGEVFSWEFTPVETQFIGHDGVEQRPEDWWTAFVSSATKVIAASRRQSLKIAAICASTQSEGTVAVAKDGTVLHPAILWPDMSGSAAIQRRAGAGLLKVAGYNARYLARWIRLTGGAPALSGKDQAAHILFIKEQRPDVYQKLTSSSMCQITSTIDSQAAWR
jgi:xylulokinase